MRRQIVVSLLESVVLLYIKQVVSSEDNSSGHLSRLDDTTENATTDGDSSGEGAFLVDVSSLNSGSRGLESKSYILPVAELLLALSKLGSSNTDILLEDVGLLLVCLLVLSGQLRGHSGNSCNRCFEIQL